MNVDFEGVVDRCVLLFPGVPDAVSCEGFFAGTGPFEGALAFDLAVPDTDPRDGNGEFGPVVATGQFALPGISAPVQLEEVVSSSDGTSGVWEASGIAGVFPPVIACILSFDLSATDAFNADLPLPPIGLDSQPASRVMEWDCSLLDPPDVHVLQSGTVDAISYGDQDGDGIVDVEDPDTIIEVVNGLPAGVFGSASDPEGQRSAMVSRLQGIEAELLSGDPDAVENAIRSLRNLRKRVDGCDGSLTETADTNDWIQDCSAQREVRALIDLLIDNLEA